MSNLLSLPLATITVSTGTNEDWIDAVVYLVNTTDPTGPQLDISDIKFEMEIRRAVPDNEVILSGSTADGRLYVGMPPDNGYLIINVPLKEMATKRAGAYVGDIVASDTENSRVALQIALTIVEGVTR
jgi:hypothetical protein